MTTPSSVDGGQQYMLVKVPYDYFEEGVNVEFLPISSEQEAQDVLKAYKNQVTQDRTEVRHLVKE